MRRRRAIAGEPIDPSSPSVLDGLLPPKLMQAAQDVRAVAQIGEVLEQIRKRRADERAGVIELQEVSPGVFAAPRRPPERRSNLGRLRGLLGDFDELARVIHGRHR